MNSHRTKTETVSGDNKSKAEFTETYRNILMSLVIN